MLPTRKYADAEVLDGHVHQGIKNAPDKRT